MPFIIKYKTGETDDLFWSFNDATDYANIRQHRDILCIVEVDSDDLHFRRFEKKLIYYVYSSKNGTIEGVFLSEDDALDYTDANNMKVEKDFYIKRLLTPHGRFKKVLIS